MKGEKDMTKRNERKYTNAPRGVGAAIAAGKLVPWEKIEHLMEMPAISDLASGLRTRKTSISLTEYTIDKFKDAAEREEVPYQQLIREVLQWYAQHYLNSEVKSEHLGRQ